MKICFVTPRFPYPITKGDTLRAYHQIRELSREHSVHLVAASEIAVQDAAKKEMEKYCSSINIVKTGRIRPYLNIAALGLSSPLPLQVLYFDSPRLRAEVSEIIKREVFDIIHAMTIRVAPSVLSVANVPVVVDFMDSFGANISTRRALVGPVMRRLYDFELARVARYEQKVARQAAGGLVIAELDRDTIREPRLAIIPNGVDTDAIPYYQGVRDPETVIFTGNMGYQPNVDAVTWFAAECWPRLRENRPNLRFIIVGARPAHSVKALERISGIEVTGRVPSMAPYLDRATISVCPIRCGSGMQNKVLEAMASGVPVVTTPFANRSIAADGDKEVQIAAASADFVDAVLKLLSDPALAHRQSFAARRLVETHYTWKQRAKQLVETYERAIDYYARLNLRRSA